MTGIYIHVPFCGRKCPYCGFYSESYRPDTAERYVQAVCRNAAAPEYEGITADTVYFGGGTPSLLTGEQLSRIMSALRSAVELSDPEVTLEANPVTLTPRKLEELRAAGINRLSVGVQSADDEQLGYMGRLHDFRRAEKAVRDAAAAGFDNISCDLILGVKGQDAASLDRTVDKLLSLPICHLSAYMLQIESGTPFDCDAVRSETADDDLMCDLYLRLCERMSSAGFEHYEISSWARPGRRSRHNMKYWTLEPYIGIGPGAHSDFGGVRYSCPPDVQRFISSGLQPRIGEEMPERAEEYVMLSLRLSEGLALERLRTYEDGEALAVNIVGKAPQLIKAGLLRPVKSGYALTEQGLLVSNSVIGELIT